MTKRRHLLSPLALLAALLFTASLLGACSNDSTPAPSTRVEGGVTSTAVAGASTTPGSSPTAIPTPAAPPTIDVDRVLAHLRALTGDIGVREAGTEGERKAARYIEGVLKEAGYTTAIEPFSFTGRFEDSTVTLPGATVRGLMFEGSLVGRASGALVDGGRGQPAELAGVRGRVAVVRRGGLTFADKVSNARAAGALGLVVVNNENGPYRGTLGSVRSEIPVVGVSGAEGAAIYAAVGREVTVEASSGSRMVNSENAVGRNGECRAYVGAHYDSVPGVVGANDNGSGTAVILELARVHRVPGLCFIGFGAEEVGLRGSQAFVSQHSVGGARFMLNFDMNGRVDDAMLAGDATLMNTVLGILGPSYPIRAGAFPPFASSDHVSFISVGVPAITVTSGNDPNIHAPRDDMSNVDRESLSTMLRAGDAALAALTKTLGEAR